ncbi:RNA polymerase sigma-70 factor [Flagellimonas marinaquae]|uniref:RNA polymerase sigma factor n=1 Tax=Flagellimonas aurea TaxID=2915619 RepID=UPI001CE09BCC|nr:RNA polymerase sigma-70 factor [Allomuricauda aquimarina]
MQQRTDIFILNALKKGDKKVFEKLYSSYYQKLCSFLLSYCQDHEIIEDVVQDVFLNLWDKRREIKIQTSLNAFLYKSVYNKLMDKYRHLRLRNEMLSSYYHTAIMLAVEKEEDRPKKHIILLRQCMEGLPDKCREVFLGGKVRGLNYSEISKEFGISTKTVEGHIARAYRLLKECMDKYK